MFNRDTHTDKVVEMPFYYGFDVGLEVPEADVYKMLTHHREERRRSRQDRSDLRADRQGHEGLPEARRRILGRSRADPPGPREVDAREGRLGHQVGFQGRHEVAMHRHPANDGRHGGPPRRLTTDESV